MRTTFVAAALLVLGGCSLTLDSFFVPQTAWAGQLFEILVEAHGDTSIGEAGAVLQLPNGFQVDRAYCYTWAGPYAPYNVTTLPTGGQRDDPALLATYSPEPGHYLASFSGRGASWISGSVTLPGSGFLSVLVRAPATPGPYTIKVALAGTNSGAWQASSPGGMTAFQSIHFPHALPINVLASPAEPFVVDRIGTANPPQNFEILTNFAVGDVDGDGNDDFAMRDNGQDRLWLSRPGGAWAEQSGLPGPTAAGGIAFGHLNGDRHLDLVSDRGRTYFGNGGTAWTPGPSLPLPYPGIAGAATGDVDGDGLDDIALAYVTVQVFRNTGNGTFTPFGSGLPAVPNGTGGQVALVDVTDDGNLDLVTSAFSLSSGSAMVFAGDGRGNWTALTGLPSFSRFAIGDLDGNGRTDILVTTGTVVSPSLAAYEWSGTAWIALPLAFPWVPPQIAQHAMLDFDRDGLSDIAFCNATPHGEMHLWQNQGNGSFADKPVSGLGRGFGMQALATADVDGDTFPDLVGFGAYPVAFHNAKSGLSRFGSGCSGPPFAMPLVTFAGSAAVGSNNFAWQLQGGQPNNVGLFAIGLGRQLAFGSLALPAELSNIGAPGCYLQTALDLVQFLPTDAAGNILLPMPIPNIAALSRITVFAQCAMFVPGFNPLGATFSAGVAVKVE